MQSFGKRDNWEIFVCLKEHTSTAAARCWY